MVERNTNKTLSSQDLFLEIRNEGAWIATVPLESVPASSVRFLSVGFNPEVIPSEVNCFQSPAEDETCPLEAAMIDSGISRRPSYPLEDFVEWATRVDNISPMHTKVGSLRSAHLFRERNLLHHEFLVVAFSGGTEQESWLRVERAADMGKWKFLPRAASVGPIIGGAKLRENASFGSSKSSLILNADELASVTIDSISDPSSVLRLLVDDFARQLSNNSDSSAKYRLFSENCRWFARRSLLNVMEHGFGKGVTLFYEWARSPSSHESLAAKLRDDPFGGRQLTGPSSTPINVYNASGLAATLVEAAKYQEAVALCESVLPLCRSAKDSWNNRFMTIRVLDILGSTLHKLNRRSEALKVLREAYDISNTLRSPSDYCVVQCHRHLARLLGDLGENVEAINIRGKLIDNLLASFQETKDEDEASSLIAVLHDSASAHLNPNGLDSALNFAKMAVELSRTFYAKHSEAYAFTLARSLLIYVEGLHGVHRDEEGLAAAREAIGILRTLSDSSMDIARTALAYTLHLHALCALEMEQLKDARDSVEESVKHYRHLYAQEPEAFRPKFAVNLSTFASVLWKTEEPIEALAHWQESIALHRTLHSSHPGKYGPKLIELLRRSAEKLETLSPEQLSSAPSSVTALDAANLRREAGDIERNSSIKTVTSS